MIRLEYVQPIGRHILVCKRQEGLRCCVLGIGYWILDSAAWRSQRSLLDYNYIYKYNLNKSFHKSKSNQSIEKKSLN